MMLLTEVKGFSEVIKEELLVNPKPLIDLGIFSINSHVLSMIISATLLVILFLPMAVYYKRKPLSISSRWFVLIESIVEFLRDDVIEPNLPQKYRVWLTPYLITLFFFILFMNVLGLVPFNKTPTSKLAVTGTLATLTLILIIYYGIKEKGVFGYIIGLVPGGTPLAIAPLLWVIEVMSLFSRIFALMIRLFANMTGGHSVIIVLLYMAIFFRHLISNIAHFGIGIVSAIVVVLISFLELLIAFIQAYIFTILTAMFIGLSVEKH